MNIPFIRFFKKDKVEEGSVAVAPPPVASPEKPASERLGKTVMPNSSRIVGLEPVGNFPTPPPPPPPSPAKSVPATTRKVSLGGGGSIAVGPKDSASEPAAERTITLPMADLVGGIPSELLKKPVDTERRVVLKAAEVERGMSTGHPTVLLRAVYKQAPEFFTSEVPATDVREVSLPLTKVVEQFARFQVREDQIVDQECPQLETPFLQVTLEDNKRFEKSVTLPVAKDTPATRPEKVVTARPEVVTPASATGPTVAAPKQSAQIKFSPPANPATPATTVKPPLSPDRLPEAAAAASTSPAATPKPSAPIKFSPPVNPATPATTVKPPLSPDRLPEAAAPASTNPAAAPKQSVPIKFSPPANPATPATTVKPPLSPDRLPEAAAAASTSPAATPKPSTPIKFSPPANPVTPATTVTPPLSPDRLPEAAAAASTGPAAAPKPSAPIKFSPPAHPSAPATSVKPPLSSDQLPAASAAAPTKTAAVPKPSASIGLSGTAPADAPVSAPTDKDPLPLDQPPASTPATAKISPNGTGVPAAERVPASSGSPVPTPLSSPEDPVQPTRIPFKVGPPSNDLRPESKFPAARANPAATPDSNSGLRISLPLRNILRNVAPFQLSGPIDAVPETAQVEIPFSIVHPQLSLGRVAISPAQFQAALPEEYHSLFKVDAAGTPVPLLLQDVLQNLPGDSLQLRGDQEEVEETSAFETPFSKKASEDAARMNVAAVPIAKVTATTEVAPPTQAATAEIEPKSVIAAAEPAAQPRPTTVKPSSRSAETLPANGPLRSMEKTPVELAKETPKPASVAKEEVPRSSKPAAKASAGDGPTRRTALQNLLDTDEPLDAKSVLVHVSRLPGVSSCAIVFSDGLSLAGNIPAEFEGDALCAMAPSIVKRISEQMLGAKFGTLRSVTLFCAETPVSLFAHGNICLAALHSGDELAAEVRDRLGRTTQELARMYAQPA